MRQFIISAIILIVAFVVIVNVVDGRGIVTLEGYSHGIALCQGGEDEIGALYGEAWMSKRDGVMYVINKGHSADPQVEELRLLANKECAQYIK